MPIFKIENDELKKLSASSAARESKIHSLVEKNLKEVFDMHFIASEYRTTAGGRIDTLAVDYAGAPVIIEYKRNKDNNVINQGLAYRKWLRDQKIEFFQQLIDTKLGKETTKKITIDWKNPRLLCIAESYNKFDIDAAMEIARRIELFTYKFYGNDLLNIEPLLVENQKSEPATSGDTTIDDFLKNKEPSMISLFKELQSKIPALGENITERVTPQYVAYRVNKNFVEIYIKSNSLRLHLRPGDYDKSKQKVGKFPDTHQWSLNRFVDLESQEEIGNVLSLIEQSYKSVL